MLQYNKWKTRINVASLLIADLITHSLTHGAEPFLRSFQLCSYSRTFQHFMEPEGHYRVHKSPPLVTILIQINPVHTTLSYHFQIHFNIVHPPTSWSSQWSPSFWHSHQYPICIPLRPHSCYVPCPSHPPCLDHSNYTWRRVQVMKLLIMQFSPTSCHFISDVIRKEKLYS
jgi:hypothetical protein